MTHLQLLSPWLHVMWSRSGETAPGADLQSLRKIVLVTSNPQI